MEYKPPTTRGSYPTPPGFGSGGRTNRVRGHYVSLDHAIADDSQPDFCPESLYDRGGNISTSSALDGVNRDSKLSPSNFKLSSGGVIYPPTPDYYDGGLRTGETDFLKTPSPSLFPRGLPKPPKQHPFCRLFEAPKWRTFAVHTALCLAAYPFLLIFVVIAQDRTLFLTRVIVGLGCGIIGILLAISLVRLARGHLEAAGECIDLRPLSNT